MRKQPQYKYSLRPIVEDKRPKQKAKVVEDQTPKKKGKGTVDKHAK